MFHGKPGTPIVFIFSLPFIGRRVAVKKALR
jgi:hypothetical protein